MLRRQSSASHIIGVICEPKSMNDCLCFCISLLFQLLLFLSLQLSRFRPGAIGTRGDSLRTPTKRSKSEISKILKGNATGFNMLGNIRKLRYSISRCA